jgi:MEMO1 family protein
MTNHDVRSKRGRRTPGRLWSLLLILATGIVASCQGQGSGTVAGEAAGEAPGEAVGEDAGEGAATGETAAATEADKDRAVRPSPIAGSWYSGKRDDLHRDLHGYLDLADPYEGPRPLALLAPHAGYRYSGAVAAYSFRALEKERYDRIFILGPAHRARLSGLGIGPWTHYETPLGPVPVDTAAVERLTAHPLIAVVEGVDADEHSVEMEVPFLQVTAMGSTIVPIVVGDLDADGIRAVATALSEELGPGDLVVVSSDFTHYGKRFGYTPEMEGTVKSGLEKLDMGAYEKFAARDADGLLAYKEQTGITVCGFRPLAILAAMLPGDAAVALRKYDTSGRMLDDWDSSVSYVAAVASGSPWSGRGADQTTWRLSRAEQQTLLKLARDSIEARLDGRSAPDLADYPITAPMREDSGVFVTLTIDGQLRGCIGEIPPSRPLAEAVRDRAADAAVRDRRFHPLTTEEYAGVDVEISALTPPKPVAGHEDIVLGRDGIYLIKGARRAVYLPQVAVEQGWTLDQTLSSLARKAGLAEDAWKDECTFEVFQAQVFHE